MELIARDAYFAGIVDGEGTIQIVRQSNSKTERPPYITGGLYVTNSNLRLLNWIQDNFGGNITKARQRVGQNWKPVYRIQFYGKTADSLVRLVQPYLVVKQEQAVLYLELRDRMKMYRHPLSAVERATREQLYLRCKQLNHRGIGQVERLSEPTSFTGGCNSPFSWELNHERPAEMTGPLAQARGNSETTGCLRSSEEYAAFCQEVPLDALGPD